MNETTGVQPAAKALLAELESSGFALRLDGMDLVVSPASKLSDDQRRRGKELKPDLIRLLVERVEAEREGQRVCRLLQTGAWQWWKPDLLRKYLRSNAQNPCQPTEG